jgi:uncharacterized protein YaiL (DUF2058 family)
MSESLRDQLLKAGFAPKKASAPEPRRDGGRQDKGGRAAPPRRDGTRDGRPPPKGSGNPEIDLAKAYALRERTEREAREREQREAERRAREKRERRQKLAALLEGKGQNDAAAEIPRHFPHGNRIRRIYVTAAQLSRLNGGELAVVQAAGRYLLVAREVALEAKAIDAEALVLLCDPHATDDDGIPADLVW